MISLLLLRNHGTKRVHRCVNSKLVGLTRKYSFSFLNSTKTTKPSNILLLVDHHHAMSQRIKSVLEHEHSNVVVHLNNNNNKKQILQAYRTLRPDLILCPFPNDNDNILLLPKEELPPTVMINHDSGRNVIAYSTVKNKICCWATRPVEIRRSDPSTSTKSSIFKKEVTQAAVECIRETVDKIMHGNNKNMELQEFPAAHHEQTPMIDFHQDASEVCRQIASADGTPGALGTIIHHHHQERELLLFDARIGSKELFSLLPQQKHHHQPGTIVAHGNGAVAVACGDSTVAWIGHAKENIANDHSALKLPTTMLLNNVNATIPDLSHALGSSGGWHYIVPCESMLFRRPRDYVDIWTSSLAHDPEIIYVHFDLYNGAISARQCRRLRDTLRRVAQQQKNIKVAVLTGGYDYFSNGINLNNLNESPRIITTELQELLRQIHYDDILIVAAWRGGAGGYLATMADWIVTHDQVMWHSHYPTGGSFFGRSTIIKDHHDLLVSKSISAHDALHKYGLVDDIILAAHDTETFQSKLHGYIKDWTARHEQKKTKKQPDEKFDRQLQQEMTVLKSNLESHEHAYARNKFVTKQHYFLATPMRGVPMKGNVFAKKEMQAIRRQLESMSIRPGLAVLQLGQHRQDSMLFAKKKLEACQKLGMYSIHKVLSDETTADKIIRQIEQWNDNPNVHGIVVQLPLPDHLNTNDILSRIAPEKDVDGLNPQNLHLCAATAASCDNNGFLPSCPLGMMRLLFEHGVPLKGAKAAVLGTSFNVGLPTALLLEREGCQVQMINIHHRDLKSLTQTADIVVSSVGIARYVLPDMIREGAVLLDCGINVDDDGKLAGDFHPDAYQKASLYTPVPGGIGPVTIATLMSNVARSAIRAAERQERQRQHDDVFGQNAFIKVV